MTSRNTSRSIVAAICLVMGAASAHGQQIVFPGGSYTITTPGPTTITQTATSITLSWGAPAPPPVTPPTPTPSPVPTQSGDLFLLALFDPTSSTPNQTAVQTSLTIGPALAPISSTAKTIWVAGDVSSLTFAAWAPSARTVGLPAVLVIATDSSGRGKLVEGASFTLAPSMTEADVIAKVKALRGLK